MNLGAQGSFPCTRQTSFSHCQVTVHTHTIQEWRSSVEAEVGVDEFGRMALEFELMAPPSPRLLQFPRV